MGAVSIVITNFNKGSSVLQAVESALFQLEDIDEIIFVDDCSTDGSGYRAEAKLEKGTSAYTFIKCNQKLGPGGSKNLGISRATNALIVLIDADDLLAEDAVPTIRSAFAANPCADFLFGDYLIRDVETGSEELQSCSSIADGDGWLVPAKLAKTWILLGSSPLRRSAWQKFGGFGEKHHESDDIDFFRNAIVAGARGYYLGRPIYIWNRSRGGNNASATQAHKSRAWLRNWRFYAKFLPIRTFRAQLFTNLRKLSRWV